ncbi:MAG: SusD/RagB family nutrient-binding outer membrane lipoprotein [Bacteroidota bacterium]
MRQITIYTLLLTGLLFSSSCEKGFEELNKNPFEPIQVGIGPLFNNVVASLRLGWNEQFYLHNETLYKVTQQAALTAENFQNISIGTEEVWNNYYSTLAHIRELDRRFDEFEGEEETLNNVRATLKILLAYKTFRLSDLFGDIPFFEAGKGFQGVDLARPAFDDQEAIYKFLLEELQWASENINTLPEPMTSAGQPYLSWGEFDNLFGNDMRMWQKFANALRLRHAIRMVEKDPAYATPIIKEIIENDLPIIEKGEDVILRPQQLDWENLGLNWSFREHKKLRLGTTMWQQLSESDHPSGSGIFDPRAHIFFEPNNAGEWVAFPQLLDNSTPPSGGTPYQQIRDANYSFKGMSNIYSPFNYYLIRDEDHVPELLFTAAEVHFLKSEAFLRGLGVASERDGAEGEYTEGVVASIQMWQDVMVGTSIWENQPPLLSQPEIFGVAFHPRISSLGSPDLLRQIYTQRWIDAFRQPWEAYALARRTGMTPREGPAIDHFRFPYPPSEAENNSANWSAQVAKMGEDSQGSKVWWMP